MIEPCRKEDDTTTTTAVINQPGPETVNDSKQQQAEEEYFERRIEFEAPEVLKLFPKFKGDKEAQPGLKILQKWDSDESGVVWDASLLLAKYLERLAASKDDSSKKRSLFSEAKAVELGSGTGFLGLWLAAMGARVLLTDLPSNLELMKQNLKLNSSSAQKDGLIIEEDLVSIAAFDWLDGSQRQTERDFLGWAPIRAIDYFIVSDCLYYKE
ncbi:PREDICTED: protein-lysine methyltransferase METTL21D-like, partial [Rhagoletis zephyria]|uniref:protein-lysine methyltransferase METTL21D-like n=1 Tax=Rhagoletis zephyria TaxID=28612 RepID=UPI00081175F2